MQKTLIPALLVIVSCMLSGCVVRSIYPWLPESTRITDISLAGTWHDEKENDIAFFSSGSQTNYNVLFISDKKDQAKFKASLHRLEKTLFLVVGPEDQNDFDSITLLPAHLLFRVELEENTMKLFGLNLESFGARLDKTKIKLLEEGSKDKGYILLSPTEDLTSFIKSQLKDKSLFDEKPMYTFKKLAKK